MNELSQGESHGFFYPALIHMMLKNIVILEVFLVWKYPRGIYVSFSSDGPSILPDPFTVSSTV